MQKSVFYLLILQFIFVISVGVFGQTAKVAPASGSSTTEKLRVEQKAQSETLELNKPTERILGGGEKHNYQIKLAAGQLLHIVVEQKQINVRPTLLDPNGKKVAEVNYAVGVIGTEHLYYVGEENGVYELSIRAEYETALAGRYRVEIIELRAATQSDEKRMTAEHQLRAAKEFYELKNDNASRQSAEMFEEATRLYRELGDARGEEIALTESALIYNGLGDARGALENLNRALELNRSLGNRSKEAYNFNIIAEVHYKIGEYHKAYEIAERALAIHRELGDRYGEAFTLAQISLAKGSLGEKREAIAGLKKAWELLRTTGSPGRFEAFASNSTASWYSDIGEYQNALDAYQHTLEVLKRSPSSQIERTVLGNLGHIYNLLGDYEKSIEYSEKTLALERAAGARPHEVLTLNNLGRAYENRGELSKAYDLYSAALKLSREIKNPRGESKSLLNIGALSLKNKKFEKAQEYFEQVLTIAGASGERAAELDSLLNLGVVLRERNEQAKAVAYLEQALTLSRKIFASAEEAKILANLSELLYNAGDLPGAEKNIREALAIVEKLRGNLAGQQDRASYFASVQHYYRLYIDILMKMHKEQAGQGYEAQALFVSERSRARNLLELLSEANADVRRGVDPTLLRRESELREILEGKSTVQGRLLATSKPNSATFAALSQEISTLTEEYEQVRARIRRTSPGYASLTQPAPLNARDIQCLLDKDTVLLEYALGDTNSFLWLVTPDSVTVYNLPNRVEIETAARRYYELLTARNEAKLPKSDAQVNETGKALGEMLLRPVADRLGSKRLVIIAEGALQYIPFASLTKPGAETKASISTADSTDATKILSGLLIEANEIIYLPSASTLSVLRREWSNRKGATKTVAVLADPVFSLADPRVKATQSKLPQLKNQKIATTRSREEARDKDLQRSLNDAVDDLAGLQTISRLPFSRREAEAIAQIVPTKDTFKALDFAASTEKATGGNLADYKIVHFATHGLLNSKNPALSGLILSLVNARGEPQNGFLRLNDIYNLRLNSDLVVLSACQTALGKDIRGEGLIGLTRGFMYAGAPRVVASLWKVDDAATAELMKRFYQNMLNKKLRPAEALRAAQIEMSKDERFKSPYFWAAFTLQGEWR